MRRWLLVLVVVAVTRAVTPASAQMPAPKVTINGLLDYTGTVYKNWADIDVTDDGKDKAAYLRQRGVFRITGEVGKTKAVLAVELDFTNGAAGRAAPGDSANFDLDTDVSSNSTGTGGVIETKWLYVETPITGPGSIMPFIPVATLLRAGAQPTRGHEYKICSLWCGDFAGVSLESEWAPNVRSTLTYAQIGEGLDFVTAPVRATNNEDFAILASVEYDIFKGLTIKPTYTYASYTCGNGQGGGNLGTEAKNGFNPNVCTEASHLDLDTRRHTIGGDVRWKSGPFTVEPSFVYQFGEQGRGTPGGDTVAIESWILDTIAGVRLGAWNFEGRFAWTPGMKAAESVARGDTIRYFQVLNSGFSYMFNWSEIQTSGVAYSNSLLAAAPGVSLRQSPSYDKYGRIFAGLVAEYAVTPALTVRGIANVSWTDKAVDTNGTISPVGLTSPTAGDHRYLGTELVAWMTYRFAPNVALDLVGAYMFVGDAMNHARGADGIERDADDVYKLVSRVRFTF
jgi:hypothetical protein